MNGIDIAETIFIYCYLLTIICIGIAWIKIGPPA